MKLQAFFAVSLFSTITVFCGCTTTPTNGLAHKTDGFPHDFSVKGKKENSVAKFFASMTQKNKSKKAGLSEAALRPRDATSLDAPATVSAELLVVTGEIGLRQQKYAQAANYFTRALEIEPENARAKAGLSQAMAAGGGNENSRQLLKQLQNASKLKNPLGAKNTRGKIKLVSHEEPADEESIGPEAISVEGTVREISDSPKKKAAGAKKQATGTNDNKAMTLMPAIPIRLFSKNGRRVANPFFGTNKTALSNVEEGPEQESEQQTEKNPKPKKPGLLNLIRPAKNK